MCLGSNTAQSRSLAGTMPATLSLLVFSLYDFFMHSCDVFRKYHVQFLAMYQFFRNFFFLRNITAQAPTAVLLGWWDPYWTSRQMGTIWKTGMKISCMLRQPGTPVHRINTTLCLNSGHLSTFWMVIHRVLISTSVVVGYPSTFFFVQLHFLLISFPSLTTACYPHLLVVWKRMA